MFQNCCKKNTFVRKQLIFISDHHLFILTYMEKYNKFLNMITKMYMKENESKPKHSIEATPIVNTRRQWSRAIVESLDFKNFGL